VKTNRELDRVDGMLQNANNIVGRVEKISHLVEQAVTSPLVKIVGLGAGLRTAASRFRKGPSSPSASP
jgi:O-methyltransferase involved in polyketide biosynthesis